jgi:hypothetical protein
LFGGKSKIVFKTFNSPKSHRPIPSSSIHVVNAHVHAGVVLIREANEHKCGAHVPTASAKGEGTIAISMFDTFERAHSVSSCAAYRSEHRAGKER